MICLESLYLLYLLFALDCYRNAEYIAQQPAGALLPPKVSHFSLLDPYLPLHDLQEILSIRALAILFRTFCQSCLIDPVVHVGDLFRHEDVDAGLFRCLLFYGFSTWCENRFVSLSKQTFSCCYDAERKNCCKRTVCRCLRTYIR